MFSLNVLSAQFDGAQLSTSMIFLFVLSVFLATHLKNLTHSTLMAGYSPYRTRFLLLHTEGEGLKPLKAFKISHGQHSSDCWPCEVMNVGLEMTRRPWQDFPVSKRLVPKSLGSNLPHIYPNGQNSCKGLGLPGNGRKMEFSRHNGQSSNVITNQ